MKTKIAEAITLPEINRLATLEKDITAGEAAFIKVSAALIEIKDSRLYRKDFPTFEAYCEKRWNFTRRRAYQLIEAGETLKSLPSNVKHCFTNARQLNALAQVPEEKRADVAKRAKKSAKKKGRKPTAKDIIEVTAEVTHKSVPKELGFSGTHQAMKMVATIPPDFTEKIPMRTAPMLEAPARIPQDYTMTRDVVIQPDKSQPAQVVSVPAFCGLMTAARFKLELEILEKKVNEVCAGNQKEREKYGVIANALAGRLMNPVKKEFNPYSSK